MSKYFPIFIDLTGRKLVLFGGGTVAARRLRGLLDYGAQVTVIAPQICAEIHRLAQAYPQQMTIQQRRYVRGELRDVDAVLSAVSDAQADDEIFAECREKGILVNIASDRTRCDFYFPALVQTDDLTIGISSGGAAHTTVRRFSAWLHRQVRERKGEWL